MNIARMKHLASILAPVPVEQFNLNGWKCGTTACAMGHAAQDPVFNEQGFFLKAGRFAGQVVLEPAYSNGVHVLEAFDGICAFFEISRQEAHRLFTEDAYPEKATPQDVVARIQRMIELEERMIPA